MSETALTARLAAFAVSAGADGVPDAVGHGVRRAIVDSIAVSVAGSQNAATRIAIDAAMTLGSRGDSRIIGSHLTTDLHTATLLNGVAAHVLDWDDTILPTRAHLSAALLPAMLALGERRGWSIARIAPAFATGFEIQARLNHAVYPAIHLRGWQGTGIVGGIGTAAAVGCLIGSPVDRIVHGMGIAATGGAGLIATFGSMSKALNIGRAGANGLQSALLAHQGFTSHPDMIGEGGFLGLFDDAARPEILTEGLGTRWSILENGYKPYPCGFVAHAMIDAVRELRSAAGPGSSLVSLELDVSPESTHLMGNPDPKTGLEAKFSLLYDAAVAWVEGNVTPAAFDGQSVADPRYRAIMDRTRIAASGDIPQHAARGRAVLADGRVEAVAVEQARGTPARPLSDDDLIEKWNVCLAMADMEPGEVARRILAGEDLSLSELMNYITVGDQ